MKRLFILSILLFTKLVVSQNAEWINYGGTVIVLYIDDNKVYIGADSKMSSRGEKTPSQVVKKIGVEKSIYFVLSGQFMIVKNMQGKIKYDCPKAFREAIISTETMDTAIFEIDKYVTDMLNEYLKYLKSKKFKLPSEPGNMISLAAITFKKNKPEYCIKEYYINYEESNPYNFIKKEVKGIYPLFYTMGSDSEILKFVKNPENESYKTKPTFRKFEKLLEMSALKFPLYVGKPFDIVKISKKGTNWRKVE